MMTLTPEILLNAYCQGIFPMANHDGQIHWYDPNPRAIFPLDTFHVPRSLRRFGAIEIPRAVYRLWLARALRVVAQF
jgi:Leu/Phe-tRNA-protein transferase